MDKLTICLNDYFKLVSLQTDTGNLLNKFSLLAFGDRVSDLKNKYPEYTEKIDLISQNDPTGNQKYLNYGVSQLIKGQALENEIIDVLKLFHKYYDRLDKKDINQWNFTQLRDKLFELKNSKSKREEKHEIKTSGATKVYEDWQVIVLHVKDKAAACFYGSGTKWCITMGAATYFEDYDANNVVFYFILNKTLSQDDNNHKIAVAIQRDLNNEVIKTDFFNANDDLIDENIVRDNVNNWTGIYNIINSQINKHPLGFLAKLKSNPSSLTEQDFLNNINIGKNNIKISKSNIGVIPDKIFAMLASDPDNEVRENLGNNPWMPAYILEQLSKDKVSDVRQAVAANDYLFQLDAVSLLDNLANDPNKYVRQAVAGNKSTSVDLLKILANDKDPVVRRSVLVSKRITPDIIRQLADQPYDLYITQLIASNNNCPPDILDKFSSSLYNWGIRERVAANPNAELKTLNKVVDEADENSIILHSAAKNPTTDADLLRKIFNKVQRGSPINYTLAANKNIPADIFEIYKKQRSDDHLLDDAVRRNPMLYPVGYSRKEYKEANSYQINQLIKNAFIRKLPNGKYRVLSEKGKNLGTYLSHSLAKKRLGQIEFFKHKCDDQNNINDKPIDLTDADDFSYSAIMRKLYQKASQAQILVFMQIFKTEFDHAVKKELQKPDKIALQKTVIKFNKQYKIILPKKFIKNAAVSELGSAEQVGHYLSNIIKFIFNRISPLNRQHSINNLKNKLNTLNTHEIANKQMPASSAIGQAITFAKHMLFGHDPTYVKDVITHTVGLL
jgi:hypothetical protein